LGYNSSFLKNVSLHEKWTGCQAGISMLGIRSNGDVLGCLAINNDEYIEGNVGARAVSEIWNDKKAFSYNRRFQLSEAGGNCVSCPHLETCRGGCCEMSLMKTGVLHNDYYCFFSVEKELFGEKSRPGTFLPGLGSKRAKKFAKIKKIFLGERNGL